MFKGRNHFTKEFIQSRIEIDSGTGCWNWRGYIQSSGYGQFLAQGKRRTAHRAAWQLWNAQLIPNGLFVCHHCDNRKCCNPAHLFLGSAKDNTQGCITKQRHLNGFCKGHTHSRKKRLRKLTDKQVREIRATRYNKERLSVIAVRYGVSLACVSTIRRGLRKQLVA